MRRMGKASTPGELGSQRVKNLRAALPSLAQRGARKWANHDLAEPARDVAGLPIVEKPHTLTSHTTLPDCPVLMVKNGHTKNPVPYTKIFLGQLECAQERLPRFTG